MADNKESLFDIYKSTGGKVDKDGAASRQDFTNFLRERLKSNNGTLDEQELTKFVDKIDAGKDGKITAADVNALSMGEIIDFVKTAGIDAGKSNDDGFLKKTALDVMAVIAPVRFVQAKALDEIRKDADFIAGKSKEGGDGAKWVSENGGKKAADWLMDNGLGAVIATLTGADVPSSSKFDFEDFFTKHKGAAMLGIIGLIGGLLGGGGALILLGLLAGVMGGAWADGSFGGGVGGASQTGGASQNKTPNTGQSQQISQEPSVEQSQQLAKQIASEPRHINNVQEDFSNADGIYRLTLDNGKTVIEGTVNNNIFTPNGVAIARFSDNQFNNADDGKGLKFAKIDKNYSFPIVDGQVVVDHRAMDFIRRRGIVENNELANPTAIAFLTEQNLITPKLQEQAKAAVDKNCKIEGDTQICPLGTTQPPQALSWQCSTDNWKTSVSCSGR